MHNNPQSITIYCYTIWKWNRHTQFHSNILTGYWFSIPQFYLIYLSTKPMYLRSESTYTYHLCEWYIYIQIILFWTQENQVEWGYRKSKRSSLHIRTSTSILVTKLSFPNGIFHHSYQSGSRTGNSSPALIIIL